MAQADRADSFERAEQSRTKLDQTLQKLSQKAERAEGQKKGLSKSFVENVSTAEEALALCERSMENLAMDYVRHLEAFRDTADTTDALHYLNKSEEIWASETATIRRFDEEGSQEEFFQDMRQLALRVLENRLDRVATVCARDASPENIALVIAILSVLDTIWGEMGFDESYTERRRIRETVLAFKDS
jgi:hypothetical protein